MAMPIEDSFHREVEPRQTLGPYRILRPLGGGGMSKVLLGEHERLRRRCAIKLLPRERVDQPGWLDRFEREMVVVAALQHAHIVSATDAGHEDGWHYLVMEYLDGLDVGCVARRLGPLPVVDACEIVRQAALGLSEIHAAGLVHRDIKPSNLMLTRSGIVKVLDLGLVLAGDDPIGIDDRLTTVGHLMGTVAFMSPEQLADSRCVDARADVYSLGATLFRLIAGRSPFESRGGLTKQILAITQTDAPRLDKVRNDVPEEVTDLVAAMLARDPASRPSAATEIAERLEPSTTGHQLKRIVRAAACNTEEESSRLPGHPLSLTAVGQPPRRRRRWWMAGGLFAFAILAAIVLKVQTDRGILVVHSENDDLTLVVSQDDQVVERLQIDSRGDHRTVLKKGSYRVAVEGGGKALKLSDEVVTIGRGTQSTIEIRAKALNAESASSAPGPEHMVVYQGHDLAYWMHAIRLERDLPMVCRAMQAVQTLAESPEQQLAAAEATLALARRWGGTTSVGFTSPEQIDPNDGPSVVYTTYLLKIFPRYAVEMALLAAGHELEEGNPRSLLAITYLLNTQYFSILSSHSRRQDTGVVGEWLNQDGGVSGSEKRSLLRQLQRRVVEKAHSTAQDLIWPYYTAMSIQDLLDRPVIGDPLMEPFVVRILKSDEPIADSKTVELGIELVSSGHDGITWDDVIGKLLLMVPNQPSEEVAVLFDLVAERASDVLLRRITQRLDQFAEPESEPSMSNRSEGGMGGGGFAGVSSTKTFEIAHPEITLWQKAIPFYWRNVNPNEQALRRLIHIRDRMTAESIHQMFNRGFGGESFTETEVYHGMNRAIEALAARYVDAHGELPTELRERMAEATDADSSSANTAATSTTQATSTQSTKNTEPKIDAGVTSADSSLTYQGQSTGYWLAVLAREQDVEQVGEAMKALSILSTDPGQRMRAAIAILERSQQWGGMQVGRIPRTMFGSSGGQDDSEVYMAYLTSRFLNFLPSPGFAAIDATFENANRPTRSALVRLLGNAINGIVDSAEDSDYRDQSRSWVAESVRDRKRRALVDSIVAHLIQSASQFRSEKNTHQDEYWTSQKRAMHALDTALEFRQASGRSFLSDPVLVDHVRLEFSRWRAWSSSLARDSQLAPPYVSESQLTAAVQWASADELPPEDWSVLAAIVNSSHYYWRSEGSEQLFETIAQHAPEATLEIIERRLPRIDAPEDGIAADDTSSKAALEFSDGFPRYWPVTLSYYAEHADPTGRAKERIESIQAGVKSAPLQNGLEEPFKAQVLEMLQSAITRLEQRSSQ